MNTGSVIGIARSIATFGTTPTKGFPSHGCTQTRRSANNRRRATARACPFGQVMAFPTGAGRDESRPRSTSPFDEQLDAARKAISDCAAMLRAAELQLDDLQHTQIPDSGDATALSDRAFELRELLAVRLAEMDLGIRDARGGDALLPKRLSSGAAELGVLPRLSDSGSSQSFHLRHSGSSFDGHQVISPIGRDLPTFSPTKATRGLPCAAEEAAQPCVLERVSAVLIDLDGTMYNPRGAIQGADEFYAFLVRRKIPYVFLSNTGAKGSQGTQDKLAKMGFMMQHRPVPLSNIYTAAQAQVAYMLLHEKDQKLLESWDIRTYLSESEAKEWSAAASTGCGVFVVLFSDGDISGAIDPITGEKGFADWSFDVIKKASYMLSHGAELIVTAEDAFNPSVDPDYPQSVFPLPGPGMFASMFRKLMFPRGEDKIRVCGKGGVEGDEFMISHALEMLKAQGHNGDPSSVMIIGDRFDTDVRAGVRAGLRTCLVESGCHAATLQPYFPRDRVDYVAANLGELLPPEFAPRSALKYGELGLGKAAREVLLRQALASSGGCVAPLPSGGDGERKRRHNGASGARSRTASTGQMDLRSWMLARGNLIYAAANGGGSDGGDDVPLMLKLHAFFGTKDPHNLGTIGAEDVQEALRELGLIHSSSNPASPNATPVFARPKPAASSMWTSCHATQRKRSATSGSDDEVLRKMVDVCSLQSGAAGAEPTACRAGSDDVEDFTTQYRPRGLDTFTVGASTYTVVTNFCGSGDQIIDLTDLGKAAPEALFTSAPAPRRRSVRLSMDDGLPSIVAPEKQRFNFAQFVREIKARALEFTGHELSLFDLPPDVAGSRDCSERSPGRGSGSPPRLGGGGGTTGRTKPLSGSLAMLCETLHARSEPGKAGSPAVLMRSRSLMAEVAELPRVPSSPLQRDVVADGKPLVSSTPRLPPRVAFTADSGDPLADKGALAASLRASCTTASPVSWVSPLELTGATAREKRRPAPLEVLRATEGTVCLEEPAERAAALQSPARVVHGQTAAAPVPAAVPASGAFSRTARRICSVPDDLHTMYLQTEQEAGMLSLDLLERSTPDLYSLELECRRAQEREEASNA